MTNVAGMPKAMAPITVTAKCGVPFVSCAAPIAGWKMSGVMKLIGLGLSCWARTCSCTAFAAFEFKGLEPGNPRLRPFPRLAHFEQYFWRLPEPLRLNEQPHERHFFFKRASYEDARQTNTKCRKLCCRFSVGSG